MADYTDEEKQAIAKFKRHFREIKTARIGWAIRAELEKHNDALWAKQRLAEDEEHQREMTKLPAGTVLLVKFHQLANQKVKLVKHGRKYAIIEAPDGKRWKYPYRALTDKIEDKMEKMTAQTNQQFQPLMKLFNETAEES
jgi:hypothetical protein